MMESHTVALKPYFIAAVARISIDTHTHNLSSACKQGRAGDHSTGRLYLRRACAARVTALGRCVSVSVCPFQFSATRRNNIVKSLHQRVRRYICLIFKSGDFRIYKHCVQSYGKSSQYANQHRLTSTGCARSVYLEGTRYNDHNEGRVSNFAYYLVLQLVRVIRATSGRPRVNAYYQPSSSITSGTAHEQFAEGLHFNYVWQWGRALALHTQLPFSFPLTLTSLQKQGLLKNLQAIPWQRRTRFRRIVTSVKFQC